jgi:hypothetical protein
MLLDRQLLPPIPLRLPHPSFPTALNIYIADPIRLSPTVNNITGASTIGKLVPNALSAETLTTARFTNPSSLNAAEISSSGVSIVLRSHFGVVRPVHAGERTFVASACPCMYFEKSRSGQWTYCLTTPRSVVMRGDTTLTLCAMVTNRGAGTGGRRRRAR